MLLADGAGIDYAYSNGMPTSAGFIGGSFSNCPSPCRGRTTYDNAGRLTQVADLQGYVTRMQYDLRDNVIAEIDPLGKSVTSEYDRRNRLVRRVDRAGNVTTFAYDNNNNLIRQTDALSQATAYEYDAEDRLIRTIDAAGNIRSFTFDAVGRIIRETDGLGNVIRREYDAVGNEIAAYDARGFRIKKTDYDPRNIPTTVQDGFGHTHTTSYDLLGRKTSFTDALNRTSTFTYDVLDRIIEVRDPMGRIFKQEYERDDVVSRILAPRNVTTEFRYNPANLITAVETSGNQLNTFQYDGGDRLTRETTVSGKVRNYLRDAAGRITSVSRSGGGFSLPNVLYSYDDNGKLRTVRTTTSSNTISRDYDRLNRLSSFTDMAGNRLTYSYDKAGNLSLLTYPDGSTVTYGYDAANRLVSVKDWANRITHYSYDANGNITNIIFPNGTRRRMTYDVLGQVNVRQDLDAQGRTIVAYRYSYDAAGQVTAEVSGTVTAPYAPSPATMTYGNDNQLVTFNGQPVTFDREGNMTSGPLGGSPANYRYDFNNNLIQAGNISYAYDLEDRLTGITVSGAATTLVNNPGAGGSPGAGFSQVLLKRSSNGVVTRYVWGVGLAYEETGNQIRVYHHDYRGSTAAFTGNAGTVTGRVSYGPFGEIAGLSGDADSLFLYGGLFGVITDPQGLNYMRFRWYSSQIKRFINQDAHFGDITIPRTLNRFTYVGNDPISGVDPEGEWCLPCIGAIAGAAIGVLVKGAVDLADDGQLNDPLEEYAGAALGGALTGGILTACPTCLVIAGALGGAANYLSTQGLKGEDVDPVDLLEATVWGGATGWLPGGLQLGAEAGKKDSKYCPNPELCDLGKKLRDELKMALRGQAKAGPVRVRAGVISRPVIVESGRQAVNQGRKGTYGEYIHYRVWLDALRLAGRPVPNNPNHVLATF
jgi:RHS repeat-associated protein